MRSTDRYKIIYYKPGVGGQRCGWGVRSHSTIEGVKGGGKRTPPTL